MSEIKEIAFPNTVKDEDKTSYTARKHIEIKRITKNWDMAPIWWFEIYNDWKKVAEIKESVCDIYYK